MFCSLPSFYRWKKKKIWGSQSFSVSCLNSHHESREGLALNAGFFPLSLTQVGKIWSPPRPSYWTLNTSGDFSFLVCKDNIHMCSWYPVLPVQGRPEDLRTLSLLRWTLQILWGWITSKVFGFNLEISAFQATADITLGRVLLQTPVALVLPLTQHFSHVWSFSLRSAGMAAPSMQQWCINTTNNPNTYNNTALYLNHVFYFPSFFF